MENRDREAAGHPLGLGDAGGKGELEALNRDLQNRNDPSSVHEAQFSIPALH